MAIEIDSLIIKHGSENNLQTLKDSELAITEDGITDAKLWFGTAGGINIASLNSNDLADLQLEIDNATNTANQASTTANGANSNSTQAISIANGANTNSTTAVTIANDAVATSDLANTNSTNAINISNEANTSSATANTTAENALTVANGIDAKATLAITSADNANSRISSIVVNNPSGTKDQELIDIRHDNINNVNYVTVSARIDNLTANIGDSANLQSQITNLAGTGRTTETVKGNADAVVNLNTTISPYIKNYGIDIGIANVYSMVLSPVPTALIEGNFYKIKATNANTGASTLQINTFGAIPIKKKVTANLVKGDILVGQVVTVIYDGTNFQLVTGNSSGDITPPNVATSFAGKQGNALAILTWVNPTDTDFAGVKILRNATGYPTSFDDANSTSIYIGTGTTFTDTGLTNDATYYYRIFPYDTSYNYNTTIAGQEITVIPRLAQEYGIRWTKSTDTITRLGAAVGKVANANGGTNNFDTLMPWSGQRRCNLSDIGVVNAYYGDPTYKVDGTNGQVMVEIPKFWFKVVNVSSDIIEFWISDNQLDGYEVHPAFFRDRLKLCDDQTGTAIEVAKRYIGAYEGCQQNGNSYVSGVGYGSSGVTYNSTYKLASVSGWYPTNNINIDQARTLAKNRGVGWSMEDYYITYAVQLLYVIEYANFNSQAMIGSGNSQSTTILSTGTTDNKGNVSYGDTISTSLAMSYRGVENFYGNISKWIDGYYCNNGNNIVIGKKGFNDTGIGYDYTYVTGVSNIGGYVSDIFGDKYTGFSSKAVTGSATTKLCDNGYLEAGYLPVFGGYCYVGASCGCFCLDVHYSASDAVWGIAARLAY